MKQDQTDIRYCLYVRKSSEEEDRQALSLKSQINEMNEYAKRNGIRILEVFKDSASAHKTDNRPAFKRMMTAIGKGKVNGILTWNANRLARNMKEGGVIIDHLQHSIIRIIDTPGDTYRPHDSMLVLTIKFGMSSQYSIDLSNAVHRGNKTKIDNGGWAGVAPIGYLNNKEDKTIEIDPNRFKLIQRLLRLYLKGESSIKALCHQAKQWGLKTRQDNYLNPSALHKILTNPFYYGELRRGEHKAKGIHKPMISRQEFTQIQRLLKSKGSKRPDTQYFFPYTCFMQCGECNRGITCEEKFRYNCSKCNRKQTAKKPKACPCGHNITKKEIDKARRYYYYHCTSGKACKQGSIRREQLEEQFLSFVDSLQVNQNFIDWAERWIDHFAKQKRTQLSKEKESRNSTIKKLKIKIRKLTDLRMDGELNKEEFIERKNSIEQEVDELEDFHANQRDEGNELKVAFELLVGLAHFFKNGVDSEKDRVLRKIVSNPVLINGKAHLQAKKHYLYLPQLKRFQRGGIEPRESLSEKGQTTNYEACYSLWLGMLDMVRTS